jgi:hypothetical protein
MKYSGEDAALTLHILPHKYLMNWSEIEPRPLWWEASPVQFSPVNCWWPLPAQSFLVSAPVGTHDHIFVFRRLLRVLKWGLFFGVRCDVTTTGPSPSTHSLSDWVMSGPCSPMPHIDIGVKCTLMRGPQFDSYCVFLFYIDNIHHGTVEYAMQIKDGICHRIWTAHPSWRSRAYQNYNPSEICNTIANGRLFLNGFLKNILLERSWVNGLYEDVFNRTDYTVLNDWMISERAVD